MQFRIGVNSGDVMVEGEQIYGDGVNVAARLESLADPGGICISGTVHEQVRDRLPLAYEDRGEQSVKNIARPVRVWRVLLNEAAPSGRATRRRTRRYLRGGVLSLAGLAIIAATIVIVQHMSLKPPHTHASIRSQDKPVLSLPSIPSIAVLPFTNLSNDPGQEYFSDGLTDNLITRLSGLPGVFVIAVIQPSFTKAGPQAFSRWRGSLGVRTILEGTVLKTADRIRINVQLADGISGGNVWAQSFDQPLKDIFAMQDDVVRSVVTTLNLFFKLGNLNIPNESARQSTDNLEAFDDFLRGVEYLWRTTRDAIANARELFEKAIALDARYADAYALLGWTYSAAAWFQWSEHPEDDLRASDELARKALALDDSNLQALALLCRNDWLEARFDEAIANGERAVTLNPNYAEGYFQLGEALVRNGQPEQAIDNVQKAIRLDPKSEAFYAVVIAAADLDMERYQQAVPLYERFVAAYPNDLWGHLGLCVAYVELRRMRDAQAQAAEAMRLNPRFKLPVPRKAEVKGESPAVEREISDLRKAGLK
jgi:adenylate cyclase